MLQRYGNIPNGIFYNQSFPKVQRKLPDAPKTFGKMSMGKFSANYPNGHTENAGQKKDRLELQLEPV
jgi:hypothetical protein